MFWGAKRRSSFEKGFPQTAMDHRALQTFAMPSFNPWTSWELYSRNSRSQASPAILVTAMWRMDVDAAKFRDPITRLRFPHVLQPTVEVGVTGIEQSMVASIERELFDLKLSASPGVTPLSLDGTSYERIRFRSSDIPLARKLSEILACSTRLDFPMDSEAARFSPLGLKRFHAETRSTCFNLFNLGSALIDFPAFF